MKPPFDIVWLSEKRLAQHPPNPDYPTGIALDLAPEKGPACLAELPYPAPCVGTWSIICQTCRRSIMVTAAGRADDPVSVRIGCDL